MDKTFVINKKIYSNNNSILFEVVKQLQNIVNNSNKSSGINNIIVQIKNIIPYIW